jgi:hypothetical protein
VSPDRRQHRGAHPADAELFGADKHVLLRLAVAELSWLLSRGYQLKSALKLVGDRHNLRERQRLAVSRAACSDAQAARRAQTRLPLAAVRGRDVIIDGFNLIITVEAALGGGLLARGRDRLIRDLSSVHGSYRSVAETERAILVVGEALDETGPRAVRWLLDRPVSNSGRLAERIREMASERNWRWEVAAVFNPDAEIVASDAIAVTSDSNILDGVSRWINLGEHLVEHQLKQAWVVDFWE